MIPVVLLLYFALGVLANTETSLIRVPNYFNIPVDVTAQNRPGIVQINETTYVIDTHPILRIDNYSIDKCDLMLPYDYSRKETKRVFVKLNNFGNNTFDSNDLINVKLCWAATSPFSFSLDYRFLQTRDLYPELLTNQLDIYVEIEYYSDFYATEPIDEKTVPIKLVLSRLPNKWVPIPIELYDYIMYAIDLIILASVGTQYVQLYFRSLA